jgi:hypothetical protein
MDVSRVGGRKEKFQFNGKAEGKNIGRPELRRDNTKTDIKNLDGRE